MSPGKNAMLHRAVPFLNFEGLSDLVPQMIPDLAFAPGMEAIVDDKVFEKLPQKLREVIPVGRMMSSFVVVGTELKEDVLLFLLFGLL